MLKCYISKTKVRAMGLNKLPDAKYYKKNKF